MPYSERKGDLFEADDLDALAHGVNCRGVMGAGIAKSFADRFPDMKQEYVLYCERRELATGEVMWWNRQTPGEHVIFNLATQDRPGPDAKLRYVAGSVADMLTYAEANGIERIGMPRIGCGIGGLQWVEVRMILELLANESPVDLVVFSL